MLGGGDWPPNTDACTMHMQDSVFWADVICTIPKRTFTQYKGKIADITSTNV